MKQQALAVSACAVLVAAGCGGDNSSSSSSDAAKPTSTQPAASVRDPEPKVKLPKGAPPKTLVVKDLKQGSGEEATAGDELTTQFVAVYVTGKRFESTWEPGRKPFGFRLGADESSPGWERGLRGMKVGGRRELIVPPDLSSRFGTPPGSGPDDTLVYVIDLLDVHRPGSRETKSETPERSEPQVTVPNRPPPKNLIVKDLIAGSGKSAKNGDELTVEYVGVHYDGSPFTNSWERSKPFKFELGAGSPYLNPGWEKGIPGMKVGGRRELIVPPKLLYKGGAPPGSKPSDTLVYVIDLISIMDRS